MTALILGVLGCVLILASLICGEISRRTLAHDLDVAIVGNALRNDRIKEMERLLRAVESFERKPE